MTSAVIPHDLRQLRACMICSLVKTHQQFLENGCENCDEFIELAGDTEKISQCTSPSFEGYALYFSFSIAFLKYLHFSKE